MPQKQLRRHPALLTIKPVYKVIHILLNQHVTRDFGEPAYLSKESIGCAVNTISLLPRLEQLFASLARYGMRRTDGVRADAPLAAIACFAL